MDDPIWSDPALCSDGGDIPQWMYDTIFKAGIQAILQLNHCSEEKEWLDYEVEAFIGWIAGRFDLLNQVWYQSAGTQQADYW